MVAEYLGEAGFRVAVAAAGRVGLERLTREPYDALVLDLMLPDMDGLEVCRQLRAKSDIPVLMLTARGEAMDRIVGLEIGADDYLPKPFEPRVLLAHPRGGRGRPEATAPHSHRARRRLRLRQAAGLMRRLYLRIYLAVLVSLAVFALCSGLVWRLLGDPGVAGHAFEAAGTLALNVLPPAEAPKAEQQAALERLATNLRADVALFAPDRALLAAVGEPLPAPDTGRDRGGWLRRWGGPPAGAIHLPDGRWLVAGVPRGRRHPGFPLFLVGLIALAVGVGAYPVVRRLTARLERLQRSEERRVGKE